MATALWVKTIRHHRTDRQTTVPCTRADAHAALQKACHELDLPEPLWLDKNEREWDELGMTRFLKEWRSNISIRTRRRKRAGIRGTRFKAE